MKFWQTLGFRAAMVSLLMLVLIVVVWGAATLPEPGERKAASAASNLTPEQIEYLKMMGKDPGDGGGGKQAGFPTPGQMGQTVWKQLSDPFYDNGPNDKGIAIQLGHSLARVGLGFGLACLVAIPLGFVIGMSPLLRRAFDPFIQVLKPISPLAWIGAQRLLAPWSRAEWPARSAA